MELCDRPAGEQAAALAQHGPVIARLVRGMIAADAQATSVLTGVIPPPLPLSAPDAPVALGAFVLHEPIGIGGTGIVWRGVHRRSRLPVAVKVIQPQCVDLPVFQQAFFAEVRTLASLHHPHIAAIYDHGVLEQALPQADMAAGSPYLVMEHASAGSLRPERCREAGWPVLRGYVLSLLDALAHAHSRGWVHRDIKPANILLCGPSDPRPGLKLADFGISQSIGALNDPSGTPRYMAPEQVGGDTAIGPWTDLYALGVTVWELLSPTPAGEDFQSQTDVPDGVEAWLRALIRREPARRFRSAADARSALLQQPRRLPAVGTPPPTAVPARMLDVGLGVYGLRRLPLVGREDEQRALWQLLREAHRTGQPQFLALRGAAGVGKSRLAEWLLQRSVEVGAALGATVLHGPQGGPAHGPRATISRIAAQLRGAVADGEQLERLRQRATAGRDPAGAQVEFLAHAADGRAVVLWIDDAQWGEQALDLVEHLAGTPEAGPFAVVLTVQEEALAQRPAIRERLAQLGLPERPVAPLSGPQQQRLLDQALALAPGLAETVRQRTGGNPLFAEHLVGDWVQRALLEVGEEGFQLRGRRRALHERFDRGLLDEVLVIREPGGSESARHVGREVEAGKLGERRIHVRMRRRADLDVVHDGTELVQVEDRVNPPAERLVKRPDRPGSEAEVVPVQIEVVLVSAHAVVETPRVGDRHDPDVEPPEQRIERPDREVAREDQGGVHAGALVAMLAGEHQHDGSVGGGARGRLERDGDHDPRTGHRGFECGEGVELDGIPIGQGTEIPHGRRRDGEGEVVGRLGRRGNPLDGRTFLGPRRSAEQHGHAERGRRPRRSSAYPSRSCDTAISASALSRSLPSWAAR